MRSILNRIAPLFTSPAVLGYASHIIDHQWIDKTLMKCQERGLKPAFAYSRGEISSEVVSLYKRLKIPIYHKVNRTFMQNISAPVVLTASSGLDEAFFSKQHCRWRVHAPHSISSLHVIYPEDAFDGYNVLFSVGPHQTREFEALSVQHCLADRRTFPCGYGKLETLLGFVTDENLDARKRKHVLIAPSWGKDNILESVGVALINGLLNEGHQVTIRPHPAFFINTHPAIAEIKYAFKDNVMLDLEDSTSSSSPALARADVMISDYSGVVQEFVLLRRRPVLFVDVPHKIVNTDWQSLGIEPLELHCRGVLGPLVPPDVQKILLAVSEALKTESQWVRKIEAFEKTFLYTRDCSETSANYIEQLLADTKR